MASQSPLRLIEPLSRRHTNTSLLLRQRCQYPRFASVRQRKPSDPPRDPALSNQRKKTNQVFLPKTRIFVGIIFISALAYDMYFNTVSPPTPDENESPTVADLDARSKRESGVHTSSPMRLRMEAFVKDQQNTIVTALEALEPDARFRRDEWTRAAGGDGVSCVLQDGQIFEKAGVNTSVVYGTLPPAAVKKMRANHRALVQGDPEEPLGFFAAGLSVVLHPINPMVPTVHLNYRYFETYDNSGKGQAWWFGGGTDLTPSYLFDEDVIHFHSTIKQACDRHGKDFYPKFKAWCDTYFRIPHRDESRGVGGIFFDDLDEQSADQDSEALFAFVRECANAFLPSYLPIVEKRKEMPFTKHEKNWQQLRRGRYVEFNLVHDRGTSFGLNTPGARVESILMSLPLTARWQYMHEPVKGSKEERLLGVLREPKDWV